MRSERSFGACALAADPNVKKTQVVATTWQDSSWFSASVTQQLSNIADHNHRMHLSSNLSLQDARESDRLRKPKVRGIPAVAYPAPTLGCRHRLHLSCHCLTSLKRSPSSHCHAAVFKYPMFFVSLLKSFDDLLYELMSWLVFYPLTLRRALRHPGE